MKTNTLYKLSDDAAKKLADYFASDAFQAQFKELKDGDSADNGTFRMVISTNDVDRHGEIVDQDGWAYANYMKNPVVLWGHDSYAIPVGITDKLSIVVEGNKKSLVAEGRFASHDFAQCLRKLYDDGMLNASSVGFIPMEYEGNTITKAELLEWSFVSIPANPFALSARGYDVNMLMAKGIIKEQVAVKEGDEVVTGDEDEVKTPEQIAAEEQAAADAAAAEAGEAVADVQEGEEGGAKTLTLTLANGDVKTFKCAPTFKAGRVLSKANRAKLEAAVSALEEVLSADADTGDNDAQPEGTKDAEVEEAKVFLKLRSAMQGVFTDMGDILAEAKKDAKEIGVKVR